MFTNLIVIFVAKLCSLSHVNTIFPLWCSFSHILVFVLIPATL